MKIESMEEWEVVLVRNEEIEGEGEGMRVKLVEWKERFKSKERKERILDEIGIRNKKEVIRVKEKEGLRNIIDWIKNENVGLGGMMREEMMINEIEGDEEKMKVEIDGDLGEKKNKEKWKVRVENKEEKVKMWNIERRRMLGDGVEIEVLIIDDRRKIEKGKKGIMRLIEKNLINGEWKVDEKERNVKIKKEEKKERKRNVDEEMYMKGEIVGIEWKRGMDEIGIENWENKEDSEGKKSKIER